MKRHQLTKAREVAMRLPSTNFQRNKIAYYMRQKPATSKWHVIEETTFVVVVQALQCSKDENAAEYESFIRRFT